MKILPTSGADKKLFLISFGIAFVLNLGQILEIGSFGNLIGYIINLILYTIVIMVVIRIIMWLAPWQGLRVWGNPAC